MHWKNIVPTINIKLSTVRTALCVNYRKRPATYAAMHETAATGSSENLIYAITKATANPAKEATKLPPE